MSDETTFPAEPPFGVDEGGLPQDNTQMPEIVFANPNVAVMPSAAIIHADETFQVQWSAFNAGQADSEAFIDNLTIYSVPDCPGSDDNLTAIWSSDADGNPQEFQEPPLPAQAQGPMMQPTVGPFPAGFYRLTVTLNSGNPPAAEQDMSNNVTYNCIEILEADTTGTGSSGDESGTSDQGDTSEGTGSSGDESGISDQGDTSEGSGSQEEGQGLDSATVAEMEDFLDNDPDNLPAMDESEIDNDAMAEGSGGSAPSPCLNGIQVPAAFTTPARDLTRREARDIVVYLIAQGAFTLRESWSPLTFDAQCNVLQPQPSTHVAISPAVIDGVRFVYTGDTRINTISNLDVRMVVVLYRLAHMLRLTWGVTEIRHMGIGHGNGKSNDCHNTGRALDFAGVVGVISNAVITSTNGPYQIDVMNDWGQKPVTMPDGTTRASWPSDFTQTIYRLDPNVDYPAGAIFQDVYDFATLECADSSTQRFGNGAATTIGRGSRFILHPDYPSPAAWGRPAHQNHIHMQVGPTGEEVSPP